MILTPPSDLSLAARRRAAFSPGPAPEEHTAVHRGGLHRLPHNTPPSWGPQAASYLLDQTCLCRGPNCPCLIPGLAFAPFSVTGHPLHPAHRRRQVCECVCVGGSWGGSQLLLSYDFLGIFGCASLCVSLLLHVAPGSPVHSAGLCLTHTSVWVPALPFPVIFVNTCLSALLFVSLFGSFAATSRCPTTRVSPPVSVCPSVPPVPPLFTWSMCKPSSPPCTPAPQPSTTDCAFSHHTSLRAAACWSSTCPVLSTYRLVCF